MRGNSRLAAVVVLLLQPSLLDMVLRDVPQAPL